MKTLEIADATAPLREYVGDEPLVLTVKGTPYATLARVGPHTDLENLAVSGNPKFQAIVERSRRRYEEHGGLSSDEVRERLGIPRRTAHATVRRPTRRAR